VWLIYFHFDYTESISIIDLDKLCLLHQTVISTKQVWSDVVVIKSS